MTKAQKNKNPGAAGRAAKNPGKSGDKEDPQVLKAMDSGDGHIDKIRDIIFGRQMADYEARFKQLENRIASQVETLRKETDDQLKTVKDLLQKQNESLTERLNAEQSERGQEGKSLSKEIARTEKSLLKAIDTLSALQVQDIQKLREQLTAMSNEFGDELHIQQVETAKNLEQALKEMDDAKLARSSLSQMLIEMADKLSGA